MIYALACASGCGTRTLIVPPGYPLQFREPVKAAKVWALDKNGNKVETVADIPAGWWTLPDPGPEPEIGEITCRSQR
jgi:hypothetical protein